MNNKALFQSGFYCCKEAVYNVLSEAAATKTPQLTNREISEKLGIEKTHFVGNYYALLHGILDALWSEGRVKRVEVPHSKKMIWRAIC